MSLGNHKLTLKLAALELLGNKFRSLLTMLGIVIGIASVTAIISLGAGAQSLITNSLQNLGTETISILPGNSNENGPPASALGITVETLKRSDGEAIMSIPGVDSFAAFANGSAEMVHGSRSYDGSFSGVTASYPQVQNHDLEFGRFFTETEERNAKNVVVLGSDLAEELFPLSNPIGQGVRIQNESFNVIGVLEHQGSALFLSFDDRAFVPLKVAQNKLTGKNYLDIIRVKVHDESQLDFVKQNITELLAYRHGFEDLEDVDFSVRSVSQALDIFTGVTNAVKLFLAFIAAVSLVVGGISVMNIMLMNVKERTREIGLKKAIGAKPDQIANQFLLETMTVTGIGGVIGILAGTGFSLFVAIIMNLLNFEWSFSISIRSILVATGVSLLVGLLFGVYPARKAAQLNPIDALRYE